MRRVSVTVLTSLALLLGGCASDDSTTNPEPGTPDASADPAPNPNPDPDPNPDPTPQADPGEPGQYDVYLDDGITASGAAGRAPVVTLCTPSQDGGITQASGVFPLVVVSPGFQMGREQYLSYCEHLASWGFVVITQTYAGSSHQQHADDISGLIDWATDTASGLAGMVDVDRIAVTGHSLGGKVSILAATQDARIGAVVGWDPVDSNTPSVTPEQMPQLSAPIALIGETLDSEALFMPCAPAGENYIEYYIAAPTTAVEITFTGADHMDWVDDTSCFFCGFCKDGTEDDARVKSLTQRATTAFLRRHLLNDTGMDTYITGAEMQVEIDAGRVTVRSK